MKVCKRCGVPFPISHNHVWTNDGRLMTRDGKQRLVIVERELMAQIFESLGSELSAYTYDILRETKAFDAKSYVESLYGRKIVMLKHFYFTRKAILEKLVEFLKILGLANLEVLEYTQDGRARFFCGQCYNRDLLLGDLNGGYIFMHGFPFACRIEDAADGFEIFVEPRKGEEDPTLKYAYEEEEPAMGYIGYKTCKECGTPLPVSFFLWNLKEGTVRDTRSGQNVVFIDVGGINLAIERIKGEIGEIEGVKVEDVLAHNTKKVVDSLIPLMDWKHRRPEEQVRDLFFMAFRGMGNPIFTEPTEDGIKVRIENPYSYPMVAGIVASFIAKERPAEFTWERMPFARLEVTIRYL